MGTGVVFGGWFAKITSNHGVKRRLVSKIHHAKMGEISGFWLPFTCL
jgi:hypothetical protein